MNLTFRPCTMSDLETLRDFSRTNFYETFAHLNTPENMEAYLNEAFDTEKLRGELSNPASFFYFLYADDILAGYLKVNDVPAQSDLQDERSLELERIYISKNVQGAGLGQYLMDQAVRFAVQREKEYLWLGVWEKNEKALGFYRKNGFYEIGTHTFVMGDDAQTDYIMRKDLNA